MKRWDPRVSHDVGELRERISDLEHRLRVAQTKAYKQRCRAELWRVRWAHRMRTR